MPVERLFFTPPSYRIKESKKMERGNCTMLKKLMRFINDVAAIYTVVSMLVKITLCIIELCQNKNNPDGGHLWVIFIYFLLKVFK